MCGIVGIIAHHASLDPGILDRATQSLSHRGPDGSGTVILHSDSPSPVAVGLGNRRLAILDLSPAGHQPMKDAETGNWIVYNGELYNQQELRSRLLAEGAQFTGKSDTEVLLKAYGHWGEDCLNQLRGMFAFAIWDASRNRLFMARDQMGIKPLYYGTSGSYFFFASEIRTLLGSGLVARRLSRPGVLSYLSFGSTYEPFTMIDGISVLAPGHSLTWENGTLDIHRYWDLASCYRGTQPEESKTALEEIEATLYESIRLQTASDVGVGLFLSGGIDSSALAAILRSLHFPLSTYSIVFREADYSEAEYSRRVAKKFATDHHEILVSQSDALAAVPRFLQAMDQPTIDGLNTFLVSSKVHDSGMKVALSGLGGDELFAGYSSFHRVPWVRRLSRLLRTIPGPVRRLVKQGLAAGKGSDQRKKIAALLGDSGQLIHPYFLSRNLFTASDRSRLFSGGDDESLLDVPLLDILEPSLGMDPISQISYLETRCYMLNTLLRDADVMSMAHGLELRVPLVDHKLAEKLFALPGSWRTSRSLPKPLLVNATRGQLPNSIVHRKKRGFTLPFEHWLRDQLRKEVEIALKSSGSTFAGMLNGEAIGDVWQDFLAHRTSWSRPWSLFVLKRWCETHGVGA